MFSISSEKELHYLRQVINIKQNNLFLASDIYSVLKWLRTNEYPCQTLHSIQQHTHTHFEMCSVQEFEDLNIHNETNKGMISNANLHQSLFFCLHDEYIFISDRFIFLAYGFLWIIFQLTDVVIIFGFCQFELNMREKAWKC